MKLWYRFIPPQVTARDENTKTKSNIVFVHGTGSNSRMWKQQVSYFSQLGYPCTLIDLRGHGQSHEPYEKTDLEVHRQDVLVTLQNSNAIFPAYFVGHSLGAIVSLAIAEKHPEMVKAIFAACMPGKLIRPAQKVLELFLSGPKEAIKGSTIKSLLPWREQTLVDMPLFTMKEIANFFASSDLLNRIPEINCPIHIAGARFDPLALHSHTKKCKSNFLILLLQRLNGQDIM